MTDEIFDHFSGSSPRKVEPLAQDDLFDDLIPKPAEETVEEGESEAVQDIVSSDADAEMEASEMVQEETAIVAHAKTDVADSNEDSQPAPQAGESHWDSLMSAFGLKPAKPKTKAKAEPVVEPDPEPDPEPVADSDSVDEESDESQFVAEEAEIVDEVEVVQAMPTTERVDDFFGIDPSEATEQDVSQEAQSEMFATRNDEDSVSRSTANTEVDDDPFAAFHRGPESIVEEPVFEEPEQEESDSLIVDDNFVEFEVRELDRGNEEKRPRSRRRKRKPSGESESREKSRDSRNRSRDESSEKVGDESRSRKKRKRKRSRGDQQRQEVDARDIDPRDVDPRDIDPRDVDPRDIDPRDIDPRDIDPRDSERRKRNSRKRRDRKDDQDGKKKQKIPTWEDAIAGVVDQNIKRHKSGSGRGGRKRRNNN